MSEIRVLLVDDNPTDRALLKAALRQLGVKEVQEAENGTIALFKIKNNNDIRKAFSLFIIDWKMPSLDGLGLLKQIRNEDQTRHATVLMVSGNADKAFVKDAGHEGITDFLVKPFEPDLLLERLGKVIKAASK